MTLAFGTAGIRGPLGDGPDHMNRPVVRAVAAGIGDYLARHLPAGEPASVVIGLDARRLSREFADDAAAVLTAAGHRVSLLPRPLPTPLLAYAVRALRADAGVMITASHNPATDNGVKLYLGGKFADGAEAGAQIVAPVDEEIQDLIALRVNPPALAAEGWTTLGDDVEEAYISAAARVASSPHAARDDVRLVLTPVHGVGGRTARAALAAAGFRSVLVVPEQAEPDAGFPTAPFPNPEEPGVMDLAIALAQREGADAVIALDPDADRCAVAIAHGGTWARLHGDRVGCALAEATAARIGAGVTPAWIAPGAAVLASSIVSSTLLARIAERHGLAHRTTLTGFKWLARIPDLAFGYEEALGYAVAPELVRDKDGITAAIAVADLIASLAAEGRTLADALDDLDRTYGVTATRQVAIRLSSSEAAQAAAATIAAAPPAELAGFRVVSVSDFSAGIDGLPPSSGIRLALDGGARVIVRPSGTEPKVKAYLEVAHQPDSDLPTARARAKAALDALEAEVRARLGSDA